jgi:hypothetical protein
MDLRLLPESVYSMGAIFNAFFGSSRPEADVHGISRNNYLMLSDFVPGPILRRRTTVFTA